MASEQSFPTALENEERGGTSDHLHEPRSKWDPQNFETLSTLGRGIYAAVHLVESIQEKQLYAMKVRSKKLLQENSEIQSFSTEKAILLLAKREKHPFVVEVFGGFQTPSHIILYLEFCQGGNLMYHLTTGGGFSLERTRFYAAEVTLALKWFHEMNLLYRNLSLNDILLGIDGHIKLADFVVSKLDIGPEDRTKSFCGSAEFMPPEMLFDHPYNSSVDWWQLGIITYQMLTQRSPFQGEDEDEIYDGILADEPLFPVFMTDDGIDFVKNLLCKEPERRLGSGTNGAENVMAHAFFGEMNWDDLYHKRVQPPFIPIAVGRTDVSNFDSEFTKPETQMVGNTTEVTPEVDEMFQGFEFSAE